MNIREEIQKSLSQNRREESELVLLGVSKKQSLDKVLKMFNQGVTSFGENYVQEGVEKISQLSIEVRNKTEWHMIGALQSNKAKLVAKHFDWIQTITDLKTAQKINRFRSELEIEKPMNLCIQVNVDGSNIKNGLKAEVPYLLDLIHSINQLEHLTMRGFMIMPDEANANTTVMVFSKAKQLFDVIKSQLEAQDQANFDTLSMGMSNDFRTAIAAGSTMIRLGTALFGERHHD